MIRNFVLCSVLCGSLTMVFGQSSSWHATGGPRGAHITSLAVASDGDIFAGSEATGGVFRSRDSGSTWVALDGEVHEKKVNSLLIVPGDVLFVATSDGLFRSTDAGENWQALEDGIEFLGNPIRSIQALTFADGRILAGTALGIYTSDDNGDSWTHRTAGIATQSITVMTADANGNFFAGTELALHISTDGGESWTAFGAELTERNITAVAVAESGDIYAGTLKSGLFRSLDSGESWQRIAGSIADSSFQTILFDNDGIFVGTLHDGIFQSTNGGEDWSPASNGLPNRAVKALISDEQGSLFAGVTDGVFGGGIYYSADHGQTWAQRNDGLVNAATQTLLTTDTYIWAGTEDFDLHVFSIENQSWSVANNGLNSPDIRALARNSKGQMFAGTTTTGIFRSQNDAASWESVNAGIVDSTNLEVSVLSLAVGANDLLLAGTDGRGIYISRDDGGSWQQINNGLTNGVVTSLFVAPGNVIFAGTDGRISGGRLYRSTNEGEIWVRADGGLPQAVTTAVLDGLEGNYLCGTNPGGLFLSEDGGRNWQPVQIFLQPLPVTALVRNSQRAFFLATLGGGVLRSTDNGLTWTEVNDGLSDPDVAALILNRYNQLIAGTVGGGVFISEPTVVSVRGSEPRLPGEVMLHQNYPNPFNPGTEIRFEIPQPMLVTLRIYNLLGQTVRHLWHDRLEDGPHSVKWDGKDEKGLSVPGGIYLYELRAREFRSVRRMLLLR